MTSSFTQTYLLSIAIITVLFSFFLIFYLFYKRKSSSSFRYKENFSKYVIYLVTALGTILTTIILFVTQLKDSRLNVFRSDLLQDSITLKIELLQQQLASLKIYEDSIKINNVKV